MPVAMAIVKLPWHTPKILKAKAIKDKMVRPIAIPLDGFNFFLAIG
jgi:hypothetical protein